MAAQYSGVIQPKQLYFVHFSLCLSAEFRHLANALFYLQVTAESTTHILKRDNLESNAGYMGSPNDIRSFVQRPERDSQPHSSIHPNSGVFSCCWRRMFKISPFLNVCLWALFLWRSKCIIEVSVFLFFIFLVFVCVRERGRLSTGGVAHITGWLCGSNLCKKNIFQNAFIYLLMKRVGE